MKIQFNDINGNALDLGDWVSVSHTRNNTGGGSKLLTFYCPVKILEEGRIQPFDNFCFNQIHKTDFKSIPSDAVKSDKDYYVVYRGGEAEEQDKIDSYVMNFLRFELNKPFYTISA